MTSTDSVPKVRVRATRVDDLHNSDISLLVSKYLKHITDLEHVVRKQSEAIHNLETRLEVSRRLADTAQGKLSKAKRDNDHLREQALKKDRTLVEYAESTDVLQIQVYEHKIKIREYEETLNSIATDYDILKREYTTKANALEQMIILVQQLQRGHSNDQSTNED